jgi:serine/threonine protein kinase
MTARYIKPEDITSLETLIADNRPLKSFISREGLSGIPYIDHKCAIMFIGDGGEHAFKYVVSPESIKKSKDSKELYPPKKLNSKFANIIRRGIRNQHNCNDISGIQNAPESDFHRGITGLIKLEYINGTTSESQVFKKNADETLALYHDAAKIVEQMLDRKIIHKDIKPKNILYDEKQKILRFIDCSLMVNFNEALEDQIGRLASGTQGYMYNGIEHSPDNYALGVSFARTLIPNLYLPKTKEPRSPLITGKFGTDSLDEYIKERFAAFTEKILKSKFSRDHADFFIDQIERPHPFLQIDKRNKIALDPTIDTSTKAPGQFDPSKKPRSNVYLTKNKIPANYNNATEEDTLLKI